MANLSMLSSLKDKVKIVTKKYYIAPQRLHRHLEYREINQARSKVWYGIVVSNVPLDTL